MADQITLPVEKRESTGKGANRRLRAQGVIPGVYYNAKGENIPVQVKELPLSKAFRKLGSTQVFQLEIDDKSKKESKPALIWKVLHHPFKNQMVHVDFYGVDLTKELKLVVPVNIVGESIGVKTNSGRLDLYRDHIEVICLPLSIPESIDIDVSGLDLNQNIHVEDIVMPEGVKAVFDENYAIVGVSLPSTQEEEEEVEGEEEGEEIQAEEEGE